MSSNIIKIIACLSMLIDHVGVLLFPSLIWMRFIGRLAMPLFAFFIAEGCRYTSKRIRYFGRVFLLALLCQSVYTAEEILSGGIRSVYLNILFTFSMSIIMSYAFLNFKKSLENKDKTKIFASGFAFASSVLIVLAFEIFCTFSKELTGIKVYFDYGFAGAVLPLFALMCTQRKKQLVCYTLGLILFVLCLSGELWYAFFALFDTVILFFYNGKRGKYNTKYLFYIFYPLHLVALYGIDLLI